MSRGQLPLYGYWALVLCMAIQRLVELRRSRRHEAWLKARGAQEVAPRHFMAMRCLHAGWLGGCVAEAAWRQQGPGLVISLAACGVLILGQILRYAAMSALQERWTVRILTLPGVPPVTHGIYRYIRHPNYVGVGLELAALPLIFGSWITAMACSMANVVILWVRIRAEEAALEAAGGYAQAFAHIGRFFLCACRKQRV
jgi:methyltransferase